MDSVAAIEAALTEGCRRTWRASSPCFGYILSRVALADQHMSDAETMAIEAILVASAAAFPATRRRSSPASQRHRASSTGAPRTSS